MAVHSLFPAFSVIDYHSSRAPHKMVIPTRAWNNLGGTGDQGGYEAWDTTDRDAIEMHEDLITKIADYYPASVTFDRWTVYTMESEDSPAFPRAGGAFTDVVGEAVSPGWWQAVQATITMYDTAFNDAKLVMLDVSSLNVFGITPLGDVDVKVAAIIAEITSEANAWASRSGFRPGTLRSYRTTINNKLERQYWG